MARTVEQGFDVLLGWIVPSDAERQAATKHRASIESKLEDRFGLYRMFESGSFKHGTGVSIYSDVDLFASLKTSRPDHSYSTLNAVRDALKERFPSTYIHVSRPAVVCDFGRGYEKVEVIPAYYKDTVNDVSRYYIPGVVTEWLESTPQAHLKYVNDCNSKAGVNGGAKHLARLAKAWKYYRDVPVSSFYLEMRAAAYMNTQSSIIYPLDMKYFLNNLLGNDLAAMNDPTGSTGRIIACSSDANRADALSKLRMAVLRADKAVELNSAGKVQEAFGQWDLLFYGHFPAYS